MNSEKMDTALGISNSKPNCDRCGKPNPSLTPCALCHQNHHGYEFCGEGEDTEPNGKNWNKNYMEA